MNFEIILYDYKYQFNNYSLLSLDLSVTLLYKLLFPYNGSFIILLYTVEPKTNIINPINWPQ